MNDFLPLEPVSTSNFLFREIVNDHLANNEVVVVLIRYANWGGAKDYVVIRTKDQFHALLEKISVKTSITVFFESNFAVKGSVSDTFASEVRDLFFKEYEEYEGLHVVCLESKFTIDDEMPILFIQELDSIFDWINTHEGWQVLIGTMKFWYENNKHFITAYVPDVDGQVRPGAY